MKISPAETAVLEVLKSANASLTNEEIAAKLPRYTLRTIGQAITKLIHAGLVRHVEIERKISVHTS